MCTRPSYAREPAGPVELYVLCTLVRIAAVKIEFRFERRRLINEIMVSVWPSPREDFRGIRLVEDQHIALAVVYQIEIVLQVRLKV